MDRLHLIAEIFSRPGLWDLQSEEYKSRSCIPELWKEVATSMGPNVTVDECKRKWKNLRDAYRAEVKRIEIRIERDILKGTYDSKNDYGSRWAYFNHMKFIKDIKRPRRSNLKENQNTSSTDNYEDDDNDMEQFSEFHNIDNIKLEPECEDNVDTFSLEDSSNSQVYSEQLLQEAETQQPAPTVNSSQSTLSIASNLLTQNSSKLQKGLDVKPLPSCCKCPKRSYDQVHFLEDLEKEEQSLIKSTRLDITRSNELAHVGDSDYNFLVSFLPQLKKMNELQNLQFRAKMTDFMFTIMSQSLTNNVQPVSSLNSKRENSGNQL